MSRFSAGAARIGLAGDITLKKLVLFIAFAFAVSLAGVAHAASVTSSNFDQIAGIVGAGGTVTQVGGTNPGGTMTNGGTNVAGGFQGAVSNTTGVSVTLPGWTWLSAVNSFIDIDGTEPGNLGSVVLGTPTDITYTRPGAGGPDSTAGDGSLQITYDPNNNNPLIDVLDVSFPSPISALVGVTSDLLIVTDTAGGGKIDMQFFNNSVDPFTPVDFILGLTVPGGAVGSALGGVVLDLVDGITFDRILIRGAQLCGDCISSVEIDAIAAAPVPIPAALWLFVSGLIVFLGAARRRKLA